MAFSSHKGTESEQAAAQALGNHFRNLSDTRRIVGAICGEAQKKFAGSCAKVWSVERSLGISLEQVERAPCTRPRPASLDSNAAWLQGPCVVVSAALAELVRRRVQAWHKNRALTAEAEVAGIGGGGGSDLKVDIQKVVVCDFCTPSPSVLFLLVTVNIQYNNTLWPL